MNKYCIEEQRARNWLDQNWPDIVSDYRRIHDFPVEEWGPIAAGYIAEHFGIESMSPECVEMITRVVKELDGMEFVYDHELRRNVRSDAMIRATSQVRQMGAAYTELLDAMSTASEAMGEMNAAMGKFGGIIDMLRNYDG